MALQSIIINYEDRKLRVEFYATDDSFEVESIFIIFEQWEADVTPLIGGEIFDRIEEQASEDYYAQ